MTQTVEELLERLNSMIEFVSQATVQVESGTLANLGDLDKDVSQLCQDVETSEPDVAKEVSGKVAEMVTSLENLAAALKGYQDNIKKDLE